MPADMHTHSENSHDSRCKIEDMARAQLEKGTRIFAVTDHFDTASCRDYDVFTPIKAAHETVTRLRQTYGDRLLILSGVEISEGFWHPQAYRQVHDLADYDVIIGSVHLVRYRDLRHAYSRIDFSALPMDTIRAYMDAYFDDILTMLDTVDFDILAHLTCPLRYLSGKYHIDLPLSHYENKIEKILQTIIQKDIALEVNTSYSAAPGSFMPPAEILQKYYDLGGRRITLGSDAHIPENASNHFEEAIRSLRKIGFDSVCYYQNRKPHPILI